MRRGEYILWGVCLFLVSMLTSCSFDAPVSDESKPTFFVQVIAHDQHPQNDTNCIEITGSAMGSPIPEIHTIYVNSDTISDFDIEYGPEGIRFGCWLFPDTITGEMDIHIEYDKGTVHALITVPATTDTIKSHIKNDTISRCQDLTVSWVSEAEFFTVDVYTLDSNNITREFILDSIISDTSITIPASCLTPELTRIKVHIFGFNGVIIKPGAVSNMEGDGNGFIVAQNYLGFWDERRITLYIK